MNINITMLPKPERCPFCHDGGALTKIPLRNHCGKSEYYYGCQNISCKVQPRTKAYNDIDMTEQECAYKSIEDWNTRK